MEAKIYTQNIATINGRNVTHYLIDSDIGQINVIQYENLQRELETAIVYNHYYKAEQKFNSICKQMLNGKK